MSVWRKKSIFSSRVILSFFCSFLKSHHSLCSLIMLYIYRGCLCALGFFGYQVNIAVDKEQQKEGHRGASGAITTTPTAAVPSVLHSLYLGVGDLQSRRLRGNYCNTFTLRPSLSTYVSFSNCSCFYIAPYLHILLSCGSPICRTT